MIPHCSGTTEMDNSSSKLLPNLLSRTLHWGHQSTDSRTFLNVFSRTRTLEITTCFACWVNCAELFFLFLIKFETFRFGTQIISSMNVSCPACPGRRMNHQVTRLIWEWLGHQKQEHPSQRFTPWHQCFFFLKTFLMMSFCSLKYISLFETMW